MKHYLKLSLLTVFILLLCSKNFAQTVKITEPEFTNVIIYVNDTVGNGMKLEQQVMSVKTKSNAAAFIPGANLVAGKSTQHNLVKGPKSPVRITTNNKGVYQFIVSVPNNSVDPASIINVFKMVSEKKNRSVAMASAKIISGTEANNLDFLQFEAKKYGNSSYIITLTDLQAGEYAMTLADRRDLFFLFGID